MAQGVVADKRHEVDEFIRLVSLESFAHAYPHHLSGGMALARALINHPKLLLIDEPLGALDAFTRMKMQDEVLRLWQGRCTTMMLVTHDIDEAIYMSDSIVLMSPVQDGLKRPSRFIFPVPSYRSRPEFLKLRGEILEMLHFVWH